MPITVNGPGGVTINFPDGTDSATIDRVMKEAAGAPQPGLLRRAVSGAVDMVRGVQDPAMEGAPDLMGALDTLPPEARGRVLEAGPGAKITAIDDKAYADILQKALGDSFVSRGEDATGYPTLSYRDKDGAERTAYVNRPGLDLQDVDRGFSAAMPYIVGGGAVGKLTKGAKLGYRMAAQGLTGAGVSVGQDVAATEQGSEQGIDGTRAGIAGGLGFAAEGAAPLVQWGKQALGFGTKYVDDVGKLTPEGVRAAKSAGIDPAELDEEAARAFGEALKTGRDPAEALSQVRSNRFGIPTTKGQRTKDPDLLSVEKDIRYGNLGPEAKETLQGLDQAQSQAITNQVRGHFAPGENGASEFKGVGAKIAPTRFPNEQNAETMGQSIRGGLTEARDVLKGQERAAWEAVPDITPKPQAFDDLGGAIEGALGPMRVDAQLTPTAMRMDAELAAFREGKAIVSDGPQIVQQSPIRTLDEMRRRLLDSYKSAPPGTPDAKAAKAYYDGYNEWVWDISEKGLINGDPAAAAKMTAAREITREVKGLLKPKTMGRNTPSGRILSQVMDEADSPEQVIASLLGSAGPHTAPKAGTIDALTRIKAILDKGGSESGSMAAKETWNDIRLAYWLRLTTDKKGAALSPVMLQKNIEQAFSSQNSVLRTLFSEVELKEFRAFARGVGEAAYKDPNPSGTASALRAMTRGGEGTNIAKTFFQAQANRELFSKHNVWMSRLYRMIAQKIPVNVAGTRDVVGRAAARRAIDQRLTPKPPLATGQFGAAYGGTSGSQ